MRTSGGEHRWMRPSVHISPISCSGHHKRMNQIGALAGSSPHQRSAASRLRQAARPRADPPWSLHQQMPPCSGAPPPPLCVQTMPPNGAAWCRPERQSNVAGRSVGTPQSPCPSRANGQQTKMDSGAHETLPAAKETRGKCAAPSVCAAANSGRRAMPTTKMHPRSQWP